MELNKEHKDILKSKKARTSKEEVYSEDEENSDDTEQIEARMAKKHKSKL